MKTAQALLFILLAVAAIGASLSVFTVEETEQAILLQLGEPVGDVKGPGLHFKIPVIQTVRRFDSRILSVDPAPEQMVISSATEDNLLQNVILPENEEDAAMDARDQQNRKTVVSGEPIIVDTFARYKITDPLQFMKTLRTIPEANRQIEIIMNDTTRNILGRTTLRKLLSEERTEIMNNISARVNQKTKEDELGISIIDIRIVRADLTPELRASTVRRMISELQERATETRAKGEERALEIRSTADKERQVLLAEAERTAQVTRGEGDEIAIKTYAEAFNKDEEFYGFMRSMEAYRKTMATPDTRMILSPKSEFFDYFKAIDQQ